MKITSEQVFNRLLSEPEKLLEQKCWLLFGPESFLCGKYKNLLVDKLLADGSRELDYTQFDMPFLAVATLLETVEFFPLQSPKRVIEVANFDPDALSSADFSELCNCISDMPPYSVLVLAISGEDGGRLTERKSSRLKKLVGIVENEGVCAVFSERSQAELENFVRRELEKYGATADNRVCSRIVELCGSELASISNECAKLGSMRAGGKVSAADADAMINSQSGESVYDLVKSVTSGDYGGAVKRLQTLLFQGEDPVYMAGIISTGFTDLFNAKISIEKGLTADAAAVVFGYPKHLAFRMKNAMHRARGLSIDYISHCLELSLSAELACKTKKTEPTTILIQLMGELAGAKKQ